MTRYSVSITHRASSWLADSSLRYEWKVNGAENVSRTDEVGTTFQLAQEREIIHRC